MRRLLIVDSSVSAKSPTMRGWLGAAPEVLPRLFDEVEVWSFHCELDEPWIKWRKLTPITSRWAIQSIFYQNAVRRMMARVSSRYLSDTLVQSTGGHLLKADIRYIQFWNIAYAEAAEERPRFLKLPLKDRLFGGMLRKDERRSLIPENSGEWWCVSRGIAAPIIRDSPLPPVVRYLPNAYDPLRFNSKARQFHRQAMRGHYGFQDNEIVLAFSAFGHFERKGLRQAAQAIEILIAAGHPVRLLVLGGAPAAIDSFKNQMAATNISIKGLVFAGLVDEIERHLSSADAYFMPSHFEAFSLAEIEAGALGLRLYLTAHPGHEMILVEHENGRLLPWEPAGMATILEQEIMSGIIGAPHMNTGEALDRTQYAATMARYYEAAIARKWQD